ncbi:hypothetical protein ACJMK2_029185, partial [Sinanodonta woodiana]
KPIRVQFPFTEVTVMKSCARQPTKQLQGCPYNASHWEVVLPSPKPLNAIVFQNKSVIKADR